MLCEPASRSERGSHYSIAGDIAMHSNNLRPHSAFNRKLFAAKKREKCTASIALNVCNIQLPTCAHPEQLHTKGHKPNCEDASPHVISQNNKEINQQYTYFGSQISKCNIYVSHKVFMYQHFKMYLKRRPPKGSSLS